jgi:hypothetical protein
LPGSLASAASVYDATLLREKASHFDLSGDPARRGFVLASDQARNLVNGPRPALSGTQHDYEYRDLGVPSCNPDIRSLDRLIDDLVADGDVDPKRIYVTGWSNGATFATLYAIARHDTPTPGGNRVAATSFYAGYDPFNNLDDELKPSCQVHPYPKTRVPIQSVHRACDALVTCDASQRTKFSMPPGDDVEGWLGTLRGPMGDPNVKQVLIDGAGAAARACAPAALCTAALGTENHLHWPDGKSDGSGIDWELEMLAFLRAHPLP